MIKGQKTVFSKISNLQKQLALISTQIEKERMESNEDDTVILQELLDKKDMIEQQISELQDSLLNDTNANTGRTFHLEINGGMKKVSIVSTSDVDPANGQISSASPLAKALRGKIKGDLITIETPAGEQTIKIKKIE